MKKRILSFGIPAVHQAITVLPSFNDPVSISEYDALAFDPEGIRQGVGSNVEHQRRQSEVFDLIRSKGGVVICLLRNRFDLGFQDAIRGRGADNYSVLDLCNATIFDQIRAELRAGWGTNIRVFPTAKGASAAYFRELKGALSFAAYLATPSENVHARGGTVFAVNSVPYPIAAEFAIGAGRVCFVPVPYQATAERVGAAIARVVEAHYGGLGEIDEPGWVASVVVPGAAAHNARITELDAEKVRIEAEANELKKQRAELQNYRVLVYGYGKSVLEPVVRSGFRLLGFEVPEPDEYEGEWDVELRDRRTSHTAIGEVEGSTGPIDIDKFRQLLDYVQSELGQERDHKGILIGNGYRDLALDAAERQNQFTDKAKVGARKFGFCLLPTTELFQAVCAVLDAPRDESLKTRVRESILSTVGVWNFGPSAASSEPEARPEEARAAATDPRG